MMTLRKIGEKIGNKLRGDREREKESRWREIEVEIDNLTRPPHPYNDWDSGEMTRDNCWRAVSLALRIDDTRKREKNLEDIAMVAIENRMYDEAVEIIQLFIQTPETRKAVILEAIDKLKPIGTIRAFDAINRLIEILPQTDEEKRKRKEEIIKEFESKNEMEKAAFATAVFVQEPERTRRLEKYAYLLMINDKLLSAREVIELLSEEERIKKLMELLVEFLREGMTTYVTEVKEELYRREAFSEEEKQKLENITARYKEVEEERRRLLREAKEVTKIANTRRNPPTVFV
jgi:hypothetical protein